MQRISKNQRRDAILLEETSRNCGVKISRTSRGSRGNRIRAYVLGVRSRSRAYFKQLHDRLSRKRGLVRENCIPHFRFICSRSVVSYNFVPSVLRYPVYLTVDNVQSNIYIYYWSIVHIFIEIFIDIRAILGQRSLGNVLSGYPSLLRTPLFTEYIQHVRW